MRRFVSIGAAAVCMLFLAPRVHAQTITLSSCAHRSYGVVAGPSAYDKDGSLDLSASVNVAVGDFEEARLDVGSVGWTFERESPAGVPIREYVRIRRATATFLRISQRDCGPTRAMFGMGIGAYAYGMKGASVTKLGVNFVGSLDVDVTDRAAIVAELGVHLIGSPKRPVIRQPVLMVGRVGFGVRYRF